MTTPRVLVLLPIVVACGGGGEETSSIDAGGGTVADAPLVPDAPAPDAAAPDAAAPDAAPPDALQPVGKMITAAGGTVELPGLITVTFPPGAVTGSAMVTLAPSSEAPPAGAQTPIYELSPPGVVFVKPVTISFKLPAGVTSGDVYWSKAGGGYENIGGRVEGDSVTAEVVHFSSGYVGPAAPTRTVSGAQVVTWLRSLSLESIPEDLTAVGVAALVEDGAGGYTTIAGTGRANGTFTIDGVPDGPYWLRIPTRSNGMGYYRLTAGAVDAGFTRQGRPDAVPLTMPTPLKIGVLNATPWQAGDRLEFLLPETRSYTFDVQDLPDRASDFPMPGDLILLFGFDRNNEYYPPQFEADTSHDSALFLHLSLASAGGTPYVALTGALSLPFGQKDGESATFSGEVDENLPRSTLDASISMTSFRAGFAADARPCPSPQPDSAQLELFVEGLAGGLTYGLGGGTADLLYLQLAGDSPDVAATGMSYGHPLGGTWGYYARVSYTAALCQVTLPPATKPLSYFVGASTFDTPEALGAAPITLALGPVRAPLIAGRSLYTDQSAVGTTPAISWTAPAIGTPDFYELTIIRIYANGARTFRENVAFLRTDWTSLTLPPGILVAGQAYLIQIIARDRSNPDPAALNRDTPRQSVAATVSAIVRP